MARATRKRKISYVLPLNSESDGHRLGVNGLAFDEEQSILYSAGRDGVICAWDIQRGDKNSSPPVNRNESSETNGTKKSRYRLQVQAHTHWINDISLVRSQGTLVSASSDLSVKIWRPNSGTVYAPQTLGLHSDYVKRVASPSGSTSWVAAGGLDHKVSLWDLTGAGQQLQFDVADEDAPYKGSVYALACNQGLIATGGPESVVKLWDPRSGQRINKFVGHTDNIRDILISQDNDTILTASADKTVRLWSLTAGRCLHTLGMHKDSVWCLTSADPQLATIYSGDRSGFVVKTDIRSLHDPNEGLSIAVAQENEGINNITIGSGQIWTGTASSSINSWQDADLLLGVQIPDTMRPFRLHGGARSRGSVVVPPSPKKITFEEAEEKKLPFTCVLQMANMVGYPGMRSGPPAGRLSTFSSGAARKASVVLIGSEGGRFAPLRSAPMITIEGQNGLIKHVVLNDKQRVLTLDTTGEVVLWDLLKCTQIKSYGKQDLHKVASDISEQTSIALWCNVDTRTGTLTCTIDEQHGFDAEIYLEDTEYAKDMEYREDQRINLGRWILRFLFATFVDEELRRDESFRQRVAGHGQVSDGGSAYSKPNMRLDMPPPPRDAWSTAAGGYIPRAMNGQRNAFMTPGLRIGLATPGVSIANLQPSTADTLPPSPHDSGPPTASRLSTEGRSADYFSQRNPSSYPTQTLAEPPIDEAEPVTTPSEMSEEKVPPSPNDAVKSPTSQKRFGKFLSNFNKSGKKLTSRSQTEEAKAGVPGDPAGDSSETRSSQGDARKEEVPTTLGQALEQLRVRYMEAVGKAVDPDLVPAVITQTLPTEAPPLKPPAGTTIIIQEERPETSGATDLFECKIEDLGQQADKIEEVAPAWLADVLLKSRVPPQPEGYNKVKFLLEPVDNTLPWICKPDRTEHLNANRMLRARKMAAYIAEKLEPPDPTAEPDPNALRPDAYIELYCNNQLLPPRTTLAWVKSHIWKGGGGGEMIIQYKANGRKLIAPYGKDLMYLGPAAIQRANQLREGGMKPDISTIIEPNEPGRPSEA